MTHHGCLSKTPFGGFRQISAVCCVHNLSVNYGQIPHLQPEKCFCPRTRRGQKRFRFYSPHPRRTLRGFWVTLTSPVFRRGCFPFSKHPLLRQHFLSSPVMMLADLPDAAGSAPPLHHPPLSRRIFPECPPPESPAVRPPGHPKIPEAALRSHRR